MRRASATGRTGGRRQTTNLRSVVCRTGRRKRSATWTAWPGRWLPRAACPRRVSGSGRPRWPWHCATSTGLGWCGRICAPTTYSWQTAVSAVAWICGRETQTRNLCDSLLLYCQSPLPISIHVSIVPACDRVSPLLDASKRPQASGDTALAKVSQLRQRCQTFSWG